MPYICPVCNAMDADPPTCPECYETMDDGGRLMDFFDEYSPYLEIDGMKKNNGIPDDLKYHRCPHIFVCNTCGERMTGLIEEIYIP